MIYTTDEIARIVTPIIAEYRIKSAFLFGSYARNTATDSSDIDLMIDTDGSDITGLFSLGALYSDLEDALNKKVDLVTVSSLTEATDRQGQMHFRENVFGERVKIYDAA